MKKVVFYLFVPFCTIYAYVDDYNKGLNYYQNNNYKKAYPIILKEAKKGNKEAQYLLGNMYEHAYGIQKDKNKAILWYKKSSSYAYILNQENNERNTSKKNPFESCFFNNL